MYVNPEIGIHLKLETIVGASYALFHSNLQPNVVVVLVIWTPARAFRTSVNGCVPTVHNIDFFHQVPAMGRLDLRHQRVKRHIALAWPKVEMTLSAGYPSMMLAFDEAPSL